MEELARAGRIPSLRVAPIAFDDHDHVHDQEPCPNHSSIDIHHDHDHDHDHEHALTIPPTLSSHFKPTPISTSASADDDQGKLPTLSRIAATHRGWLTVYKCLFLLSFSVNLTCFAAAVSGHFPSARSNSALIAVANVLALVACRSELFLRLLFAIAVFVFRHLLPFAPLRNACTFFLSNLGGIHSGCGMSALLWLAYAVSGMFSDGHDIMPIQRLQHATAAITLAQLLLTCMSAFPALRHLHHNAFETVHRLTGWAALAGVWLYVILSNGSSYGGGGADGGFYLRAANIVRAPSVWATAAITLLIILPWLSVRRVPVRCLASTAAAPPRGGSTHGSVSIMHFFSSTPVQPGLLARISRSPLSEWHAFGTVSDGRHGYLIVAGAVGDFTNGLIENPPSQVWVRTLHFAGIPYLTNMYERVVHVATGSGIGVFLSFLLQPTTVTTEVHFVWVAKSVKKTYGEEFAELLRTCPADRLTIYDTAERGGRPDVGGMAVEVARRVGAQVVIVTSNPSGSKAVVDTCRANGITAIGPVWDS